METVVANLLVAGWGPASGHSLSLQPPKSAPTVCLLLRLPSRRSHPVNLEGPSPGIATPTTLIQSGPDLPASVQVLILLHLCRILPKGIFSGGVSSGACPQSVGNRSPLWSLQTISILGHRNYGHPSHFSFQPIPRDVSIIARLLNPSLDGAVLPDADPLQLILVTVQVYDMAHGLGPRWVAKTEVSKTCKDVLMIWAHIHHARINDMIAFLRRATAARPVQFEERLHRVAFHARVNFLIFLRDAPRDGYPHWCGGGGGGACPPVPAGMLVPLVALCSRCIADLGYGLLRSPHWRGHF